MENIFSDAIAKKKVRKDIYAYKYLNGVINIDGTKYMFYSMTNAIKDWRRNNKLK